MTQGKNITWYASADRTEKLMEYATKKGKGKPVPLNGIMKEMVDFFFEHGGDKNGKKR